MVVVKVRPAILHYVLNDAPKKNFDRQAEGSYLK